ncbi:MAG: glycosyltransferase [Lachnospiraceae bacterium]|nr:glycosyltransferase [Lachnospiraceae bacterium]
MKNLNVTVILPSLNPDQKLELVVDGLLREGFTDIVIVNDGSDEAHMLPFSHAAAHSEVTVLTHEINRGKGRALKTAFSYVLENRPDTAGVVTVDGDNQHAPHDIRACALRLLEEKDKVILGCRDFDGEDVPARSRFGNKTTSTVFRLLCGIKISDTQTGLRAIPRSALPLMCRTPGERFEYETEMLFALKRNRIALTQVKIDTVYLEDNSSSHFHPVRDSLRIYGIIFKFLFSSVISFLIDYGLFTLILFLLTGHVDRTVCLFAAFFLARACSSACNYLLNKKTVFRSDTPIGRSLGKYYTLCILQTALSYSIVWLLGSLLSGSPYVDTLLKPIVDIVLFCASFQVQQRWVFR